MKLIVTKFDNTHLLATPERLDGETFTLMKSFPGFARWEERAIRFRPTGANIEYIATHWPRARWVGVTESFLREFRQARKIAKQGSKAKLLPLAKLGNDSDFEYKTEPYDHQRKAFLLSRDRKTFALLLDQGTGKTKIVLDNAAYLFRKGEIEALVVIAPNGVHENWALNEIPAHLPDWCERKCWMYSSNLTKRLHKAHEELARFCGLRIVLFNIEAFTSDKARTLYLKTIASWKCMVVVDESSRIRNPAAQRTKFLKRNSADARYRRILSGTPAPNGIEGLWSQYSFLDPMIIGHDTFTAFKAEFCVTRKVGYGETIVGYRNVDKLIKIIDGYTFRVRKEECLDLPPKVYKRFPINLSSKQREIYTSILEELAAEFEGHSITTEIAIVQIMRLQQVTCGWFPTNDADEDEDGKRRKVRPIDSSSPRLDALRTILRDTEGKAVIWSRFIADLDEIAQALGPAAIRYRGDIADVARFQNDPAFKYFIANPATAGIGLTLTAAETVVYYANDFDLEHRLQSEDRTHRIGTRGTVTYIDIEAIGTIDRKIVTALREKKLISDLVMGDPSGFFLRQEADDN